MRQRIKSAPFAGSDARCLNEHVSRPDVLTGTASESRQQLTHACWRARRAAFDVYVSQVVLDEVKAGDAEAARKRIALVKNVALLDTPPAVADLAAALIAGVPLPIKAAANAAHIAVAAYHGVQFLLTWNSTHIANAELRPRVEHVCRERGYTPPILCTPDELMGDGDA